MFGFTRNLNRIINTGFTSTIARTNLPQTKILRSSASFSNECSKKAAAAVSINIFNNDKYANVKVLPDFLYDLADNINKYNLNQKSDWFARALEYNLLKSTHHRLLLTVSSYKNLMINQGRPEETNIKLAYILGWCMELLHTALSIYDDIMDGGHLRHGQICWHKLENVGMTALNDAIMIENSIYILLQENFKKSECYVELTEMFHETALIVGCGQNLDMLSSKMPVTSFTMDRYNVIASNKTGYYNLYVPFAMALHLTGFRDSKVFEGSKQILLEIGKFRQIENDYLDCFGNIEISGQLGSDIETNKCSWLAVVCMEKANEEQKQIMLDCYGKKDPEKRRTIQELYKILELPKLYALQKEESYNKIKSQILQTTNADIPQTLFLDILNKAYHRET